MDGPSKNDIIQIFKRLRSVPANKVCFDCNAKNPTWSSVTYGIFICIDCSGIHRSLGVHLTFVRSTQLDSNWTWQQLRQMQLGGNANASTFFRQHNCTTTDTQLKYKSRAAQLYREKLHNSAVQGIKLHGTKLFIDAPQSNVEQEEGTEEEEDFFKQNHEEEYAQENNQQAKIMVQDDKNGADTRLKNGAPNVDLSSSVVTEGQKPRKATIGQRKQAKKSGLGAKKVGALGAQKVNKDFSEIEKEAEIADEIRSKVAENDFKSPEEEEKVATSMRLAYQDISVQQKKEEEKLKRSDPKKAEQVERLGMGFGSKTGVSHSLLTDMGTITQEEPSSYKKGNWEQTTDDFEVVDHSEAFSGFASSGSSWENEFERLKLEKQNVRKEKSWSKSFDNVPKESYKSSAATVTSGDAMKKFGGAKAISSDMYFGNDGNDSQDANLNRFQGSNSISSAEYFNRTEVAPSSRIQSPDIEDVKESVRQGVSKVAGKLSGMASGVMSTLQEKYGY